MSSKPPPIPALHTIGDVAKKLSMTPAYVRALIRTGKLNSTLMPMAFESQVKRHMMSDADIEEFLKSTVRKTKRVDGRNKYVFYANVGEYDLVVNALKTAKLESILETLRSANNIKPREVYNGSNS
jgi:hypothetical protein